MTTEPNAKRVRYSDDRDVCIVGIARTPIGGMLGSLSSLTAPQLGAHAIKTSIQRSGVRIEAVEEVFMGNVISAGVGQAPARQAALLSGISATVPCTTVNKVCAAGMKATMFGAQAIMLGQRDIVVVGGMENMSNAPHFVGNMAMRKGKKMGPVSFDDAMQTDGLNDAYDKVPMGEFAELCAETHEISRQEQDAYAAESYRRSLSATKAGKFAAEISPVDVKLPRGKGVATISEDEEVTAREVSIDTLGKLRPPFKQNGTVTAGNASTVSDGAAALVLASRSKAQELGLKILAVIRGFDDAAQEPKHFTTSPSLAIPKALKRAELDITAVDYFEINEAFSVVAAANMKILGLNPEKVNVYGGAVSMGHPLGCSGARIIVTLCNVLQQESGRYGCAAVCNGGGGASAIVLERVE